MNPYERLKLDAARIDAWCNNEVAWQSCPPEPPVVQMFSSGSVCSPLAFRWFYDFASGPGAQFTPRAARTAHCGYRFSIKQLALIKRITSTNGGRNSVTRFIHAAALPEKGTFVPDLATRKKYNITIPVDQISCFFVLTRYCSGVCVFTGIFHWWEVTRRTSVSVSSPLFKYSPPVTPHGEMI